MSKNAVSLKEPMRLMDEVDEEIESPGGDASRSVLDRTFKP